MSDHAGALGIIAEKDVEVRMRDGTILRANVFRPDAEGDFPGLLRRTPYGRGGSDYGRYVRAGYVVVSQDTRGRYDSEGEYTVFLREETGDAEDGYDSVEWLAEQPYCDGNVGTFGASYNAWMQWQLAKLQPPHLEAMCAYTIPVDVPWLDWPGAFRPARRVHWLLTTIAPDLRKRAGMAPPHTKEEAREFWDDLQHGRWLHFMPWTALVEYLPAGLAEAVADWFENPARRIWKFDEAWQNIEVPNLDFSGYFDHCNDTIRHLSGMQNNAATELARRQTKLIVGPWNHGGIGNRKLGDIEFDRQAKVDIEGIIIRWFDRWLKGIENDIDDEPAVRYFVMGAGRWETADTWPPQGTDPESYYLCSDGEAMPVERSGELTAKATTKREYDEYIYDPKDPVPTLWTRGLFTMPQDRRKLQHRRDILYYRTAPLPEPVEIAGEPQVKLYASSSAPDTDFFARLVDEGVEDEPALEICYGMVRARHRNGIDTDKLLVPAEVTEFTIDLGPTACQFQAGHRIRLEITSSDFPNFDRNHNTGGNDLAETELVKARQRIFHSEEYPSRLILPVVE